MSDEEPTWPRQHYADTIPTIRTPPTPPDPWWARWWGRWRDRLGTAGLVLAVAFVLAGIATASFVPAVRHGVSKIIKHQETVKTTVPGHSTQPTARRSLPALLPDSSIRHAVSRSAKPSVSPSRVTVRSAPATVRPSPRPYTSSARSTASVKPTPTTVSPTPSVSTPSVTPTPTPTPSVTSTAPTAPASS